MLARTDCNFRRSSSLRRLLALVAIAVAHASGASSQTITHFAGGWQPDGIAATSANLTLPLELARDNDGNLLIVDTGDRRLRKIDSAGNISTIAGNGDNGYNGDGIPATSASFYVASDSAVGSDGSIFVADAYNNRIRRIAPNGTISTFAGNGRKASSTNPEVDGIQATTSIVSRPTGVAVDATGNVYIAEQLGHRIRKIDASGIISTIAGTGTFGYSGDGGPAIAAQISYPGSVAIDSSGNVYIADVGNSAIRKVDTSGTISTVAMNGLLHYPAGIGLLPDNSLVVSDLSSHQVLMRKSDGSVSIIAGTGTAGFSGDGGPATDSQLNQPRGIEVDPSGTIYVADYLNNRIRAFTVGGTIATVAGSGEKPYGYHGDGGQASLAGITPLHIAINSADEMLIADYANRRVRKISTDGIITSLAGFGNYGDFKADPTTTAPPIGVGWLADGSPIFSEDLWGLLLKISPSGALSTAFPNYCDIGTYDRCPTVLLPMADGGLLYIDRYSRVFRIAGSAGGISTVSGGSLTPGYIGDEGPATSAGLKNPRGIAIGPAGDLYIADTDNNRIRKVDTFGIIHTVAGTGAAGFSGDGGLAISATIDHPYAVAVDGDGTVYFSDHGNHRVRAITVDGRIRTIAGNGSVTSSGDGGAALDAGIGDIGDVVIDSHRLLYIVDGNVVRRMSLLNAIPSTAPAAPPAPSAIAGDAAATVNITPPSSNGGSSITGYTVTSSPAGGVDANAGTTQLSHNISGLVNGTSYTFTVVATNAIGSSQPSPVSNAVTPQAVVSGTPPTARADQFVVPANQTLVADALSGVLSNDSNPATGSLTAELVSGPAHGNLALASNGSFNYKAAAGYSGSDAFNYRACNSSHLCSQATAGIQVGYVLAGTDRYHWNFPSDTDSQHQGFLRLTNTANASQAVKLLAWNSTGALGPHAISLVLLPLESRQLNSHDLEFGNPEKGLDSGFGHLSGPWTLIVDADRTNVRSYSYIRTPDGFLTTMHDRVEGDGVDWWVPTFNPASNTNQVSALRIFNSGTTAADILISGVDDSGKASATASLHLAARGTVTLTANDVEAGNASLSLAGGIGTGTGKWRLHLAATVNIEVQSLLSDPNGYLTNLSLLPDDGVAGSVHTLWYVPRAANTQQQGFIRITNRSATSGTITLQGVDDAGLTSNGILSFTLAAGESRQFNSQDLEAGNASKATGAFGSGTGDWRVRVSSSLDLDTSAFIRTPDGFLTTMHDTVAGNGSMVHAVPIFNPASNLNQESRLRLVNPGSTSVVVSISGRDDAGATAPGGAVSLTLAAGHAVELTAGDLENGDAGKGLSGHFGVGSGKWRLLVTPTGGDVVVISLLRDPNGYLTNLSSDPNGSSSDLAP